MEKIEVYIISGFLGSGKTTLLKELLIKWKDKKTAVLMNEYGGYNVDGRILGDDVMMRELLNGCICCDLKSDVEVQLHDIKHRYQPDIIIIEATGIAHPVEIYDACMAPSLTSTIHINAVITIVDGPRFISRDRLSAATKHLMEEQVKYAHLLILNKSDLLTEQELSLLKEGTGRINPSALQHITQYSRLPAQLLEINGNILYGRSSHQHGIQTMTYTFSGPVDSRNFVAWLRALPDDILRIKGYLKFKEDPDQVVLFQYAYGIPQYEEEDMNLPLKLVIIGEQLNKPKLLDALDVLQFS